MYAAIVEKTGWSLEYVSNLNVQSVRILSKAWSDLADKQINETNQPVAQQAGIQAKPQEVLEGNEENAKKFAAFINSIK